jgi:hypothetical protein
MVRSPARAVVFVLLIAIVQVVAMYVGYGQELWRVRLYHPVALALFLGSPIAAAFGEAAVARRDIADSHFRIALAVGVTLVATYFGFYFGMNSYGE